MDKDLDHYLRDVNFLANWFPQQYHDYIKTLSDDEVETLAESLEYARTYNKLSLYLPYGHEKTLDIPGWSKKPWQLNFHNAGFDHQERMNMCANRVGKTHSAGKEVAYHMTGLYPDWWKGKRFNSPVLVWTGSPTNETSRDIVQKELLGGTTTQDLGTGSIPKKYIVGKPKFKQAGISDVIDMFKVRHVSGGISTCVLKTYEQGWRKWQGTAPHVILLDEEPEDNEQQGRIYTEAMTRLLTSHGIMMVTFTPLLGTTNLVEHFQEGGDGIYMDTATWEDAPHLDKTERTRLADSFPEHEREARMRGVPMMGEGRVFTTNEDDIKIDPFEIPSYFARIKGIDFGIDHPCAVSEIAWDRDKDIIYVIRTWKKKGADAAEHADQIRSPNPWVPVSWPHDGTNREKSSGKQLKDIYRDKYGVKLLALSSRYNNDKGGAQPAEPIIMEINERCRTGGFRVFSTCTGFFDEYRNYHRKEGKLTKVRDDILKSVFYAVMMRRFSTTQKITHEIKPPRAFSTA